jgi:haloalkane dehalogenase
MNRRTFFGMAATTVVATCLRHLPRPMTAASFHASRRFAKLSFGDIAYVERGSGEVALFLHGFPLNGFQWRGALDRLCAYRRCIAPDFMGLGYTRVAPGQSVTPAAQVSMLAAFLDALSIRRIDLVANDSGGAIAQLFVTRYSDRVRSLLLTNCDVEPDSPPAAVLPVIAMAREGTFADRWLVPWLADKQLARSPQGLGGQCYADTSHPTDEAIECYLSPLVSSPARKALVHAYALGLTPNPLAGLPHSDVPLRIVWGMADTIFSPSDAEYLDRTSPGSRGVHRVSGAKLFWPEEFPDILGQEAVRLWGYTCSRR